MATDNNRWSNDLDNFTDDSQSVKKQPLKKAAKPKSNTALIVLLAVVIVVGISILAIQIFDPFSNNGGSGNPQAGDGIISQDAPGGGNGNNIGEPNTVQGFGNGEQHTWGDGGDFGDDPPISFDNPDFSGNGGTVENNGYDGPIMAKPDGKGGILYSVDDGKTWSDTLP